MKKSFIVKTKVWRWGLGTSYSSVSSSWHFVTLDKKMYEQIRKMHPKGMVKVEVKLGKTIWATSLFPHKYSNSYILCINKKVRKEESVFEGDEVKVKISIL